MEPQTYPNPDLLVGTDLRPRWNSAPHRRHGFHNLHRLLRYCQSYRAGQVMPLRLSADLAIAAREDVRELTASPFFSGMVVIEEGRILYESYAPDFAACQPHSIMSISKMALTLMVGRLVDEGRIDLAAPVSTYLPWIGAGYHLASVQQVLNMDLRNDYTEDYHNPLASVFAHEAACGMRLSNQEMTNRDFVATIGLAAGAADCTNPSGICDYKSANSEVLSLIVQAVGPRSLQAWMADLADSAGVEGALHVQTDRAGMPILNGGICLTARDLARYGALFSRMGRGVDGAEFGSAAFLRKTLAGGIPMPAPRSHLRYSNHTNTNGTWLGHGGYGGQYLLANPETGRVGVFLSVLQNESGYDSAHYPPIIGMLENICAAG
jgi:CubicO group peptidase (beta-lactamase class C family)